MLKRSDNGRQKYGAWEEGEDAIRALGHLDVLEKNTEMNKHNIGRTLLDQYCKGE